MKRHLPLICILFISAVILTSCSKFSLPLEHSSPNKVKTENLVEKTNDLKSEPGNSNIKSILINKYKNQVPKKWGEKTKGVKTRLATKDKVIALTFDACGGLHGSGYDKALIDYLIKENVPATLFINSRWIDANHKTFMELSKNKLFEIENHGYLHRPLSVNGKSAYGIRGTKNISEVIEEVTLNENKIYELTGRRPKFFRPGTAFCDEIAVSIVKDLGAEVVGFNVLGDAGATFTKGQIRKACLSATPGSIIICHMNHPEKETSKGIKLAVPELRKKGYRFVKLENYTLQ